MLLNGSLESLDKLPRNLFFTGKGGVGKTTLACATAVVLADRGNRVLLVSTDPASNLDEMLDTPLSNAARPIATAPGLSALNIDPIESARIYRERVIAPYRSVLPPAAVTSIEEQLSGACTVEIAAFYEFARLLGDSAATAEFDHVIFDTAPGGHTLRLLSLPAAWSGFAESNTTGISCLGPLAGLQSQRELFEATMTALADPTATLLVLVARAQTLALAEAARLSRELSELGLANQHLAINGMFPAETSTDPVAATLAAQERRAFDELPAPIATLLRTTLPLRMRGPLGVPALRRFLEPTLDVPPPRQRPALSLPAGVFSDLETLVDQLAQAGHGLVMTMGKGGVGKTTIGVMVATALAKRGHPVHLTTTGPLHHLWELQKSERSRVSVSTIDPAFETAQYRAKIMADVGTQLDDDARALLVEDLSSPCTEEVAVFHAFARQMARGDDRFLVFDSAPTGHTLLLIDAALAYHREVARQIGDMPAEVRELLPRLRDPALTRVLLVTIPEATPIHETALLQDDLARAGIIPFAWVVNQCLTPHSLSDPLLVARQNEELLRLHEIAGYKTTRSAIVAWDPRLSASAAGQLV
jgi:arsenite-transporting ATPase